jgi:hypothetical protein
MQLSLMGHKDDDRCLISDDLRPKVVARRVHPSLASLHKHSPLRLAELSQFLFQISDFRYRIPFHVSNQGTTDSSITLYTIIEEASIIARSSVHRALQYHYTH